jgi:hypothetical protein
MRIFILIILVSSVVLTGCEDNPAMPEEDPLDRYIDSVSFNSKTPVGSMTEPLAIYFKRPMDTASVIDAFSSDPGFDFYSNWAIEYSGDSTDIVPDLAQHILRIYPRPAYQTMTSYSCAIDTTAVDTLGFHLPEKLEFEFTTDSARLLQLEIRNPNIPAVENYPRRMRLRFNMPIDEYRVVDPFTVSPEFSYLNGQSSEDHTIYTYPLTSDLRADTDYTVTIDQQIVDIWGNPVYGLSPHSFRTEPVAVEYHYPEQDTELKGTSVVLQVRFNTSMNRFSAENAFSFSNDVLEISGQFEWISDQAFLFYPDNDLSYQTIYTMAVNTSAEDLFGDNLYEAFTFSFSLKR